MIEKLKEIVKYNERQMAKVDGDQNFAQNLYTIDHEEVSIYNFFYDETLRFEVNPIQYYDQEKLEKLIHRFENGMTN